MPKGDGTGPVGQGTMSGRGRGNCITDNFDKNKLTRGIGKGLGRCRGNQLGENKQNTNQQNQDK